MISPPRRRLADMLPMASVLLLVAAVWYLLSLWLNWDQAGALADDGATSWQIAMGSFALDRPLLPAPHQLLAALWQGMFGWPVNSVHSLFYHAFITAESAAFGFLLALVVGIAAAIGIVHLRTLDRSLMPWVITSQTIPVLAIAPMVVVVLGHIGLEGLVPKALISAWLSFFPITTGMVKGLRSPDPMQRDLMRTYHAGQWQVFGKLRWPAAMAFLFPGVKVAATLALVGAIVAELPTGAQAGLGARLLIGSYYGQTLQIWAALFMAALLALACVGMVDLAQRLLVARRGGRL